MPTVFPMATPLLWLVRTLSTVSFAVASWLTLAKWTQARPEVTGCGGSSGCATILDSRWSLWFSLPVTLLAATLWLTVLLLTLPTAGKWLGRTADQLHAACGVLLIAGAIWFGGLMALVVKVWCPWCAALHLAGLLVGAILLHTAWRASREGEVGLFSAAGQAGIAGAALLVLGQLFGKPPDTHLLSGSPGPVPAEAISEPSGTVSYWHQTLHYDRREVPSLGAPEAIHLLAGFSDYTCPTCRAQHGDLQALLKNAPGIYALIVLPTPLDHACNPHLEPGTQDHPGACELASLALSLWKAAPEKFPAFHDFLMTAPLPLELAAARQEAARLAPAAALDPHATWAAAQISQNIAAWHQLSGTNAKLPKLLLRDDIVLHGNTSSRERFMEIIAGAFPAGIGSSTPSIPVTTQPR